MTQVCNFHHVKACGEMLLAQFLHLLQPVMAVSVAVSDTRGTSHPGNTVSVMAGSVVYWRCGIH